MNEHDEPEHDFDCEYCWDVATRFRRDEDGYAYFYCDDHAPSDSQPRRDGVHPGPPDEPATRPGRPDRNCDTSPPEPWYG